MSKIKIGLFGFGVVGEGLCQVLEKVGTTNAEIKKICVRNIHKERSLPASCFTDRADDIFSDPEINLIVELIDDAEASYHIVTQALRQHIAVVTGNKKMLAYHLEELIALQKETGTALLYDASACGSIPVIRNLEEYYDNELLISVKGILNGSSNFILSKIFNENMQYEEALKKAQELGFAESNPQFDVDGFDSLFKLVIIAVHAVGTYVHPDRLLNYGITNLNAYDIQLAREKGVRIKLVAQVEKLPDNKFTMFVLPQFITKDKYIYSVEDEFNGVVIKGECYGKQFMFGRGAGGHPTGASVLSDITARLHNYKYEYKKRQRTELPTYTDDCIIRLYLRYEDDNDLFLFRFQDITERYWSKKFKFVIGHIRLADLVSIKETIRDKNIFIAAAPE
ncbi:MAG: homoserine dehydrogenase [Odoribacter splanchnicus]|nr:homoserine dehydrogenase [Odoribacter splanchnicus]MBD9180685.1 homoserine dehydrogenase [Odoribacter splanchnicus]